MSCGIGMYGLQFLAHSHSHGKLSLESETLKIAELFTWSWPSPNIVYNLQLISPLVYPFVFGQK